MIKKPSFAYRILFATFLGLIIGSFVSQTLVILHPYKSSFLELTCLIITIGLMVGIMGNRTTTLLPYPKLFPACRGLFIGAWTSTILTSFQPSSLVHYADILPTWLSPTGGVIIISCLTGLFIDLLVTYKHSDGVKTLLADHKG